MTSLRNSFESLPKDKLVDGIILTSARDGIFTGGLDIFELYDTTEEREILSGNWFNISQMQFAISEARKSVNTFEHRVYLSTLMVSTLMNMDLNIKFSHLIFFDKIG